MFIFSTNAQEYYLASEEYYAAFVAGYGYAAVASTIVSGALAERVNFSGYLIFSTFMTGDRLYIVFYNDMLMVLY